MYDVYLVPYGNIEMRF